VLTDGPRTIAESAAAVEYVIERYGAGDLRPDPASDAYWRYIEWLHYAEGSAMTALMLNLYVMRLGEAGAPLHQRISSEIDNHLGYLSGALGDQPFLMGEALSGPTSRSASSPRSPAPSDVWPPTPTLRPMCPGCRRGQPIGARSRKAGPTIWRNRLRRRRDVRPDAA